MKFHIDPERRLSLNGYEFDTMRDALDTALQATVARLIDGGIAEGTVTLKLDLSAEKVPCEDKGNDGRTIWQNTAEIRWRVATAVTEKGEAHGRALGFGDKKVIVVGDDGQLYLLTREEYNGQMSMFGGDGE